MSERNHDGRNQDDWMQGLALRVEELVRRPAVRERFRAMIDAWRTEWDRQLRAVEQWERRRAEHFKNEVTTNPQLQDRACGPPAEGWRFQPCFCSVGDSRNIQTGGWFPPDLCLGAKPQVDDVLSFAEASRDYDLEGDPKRPLTLPEKYALCAALHDAYGHGLEPIVPDESYALSRQLDILQPGDRPLVEAFLEHVVEDLTMKGMLPEEGAAGSCEEGKASPMPDTLVDRPVTSSQAAKQGKTTGKSVRRRRTAGTRPLTPLQQQALELWAKHDGKLSEVAREMGITHVTARQHLQAAWRKIPHLAPKPTGTATGRTRRLPTDRRGQVSR